MRNRLRLGLGRTLLALLSGLCLVPAAADEPSRWRDRITEEQGIDYRGGDYHSFRARNVSACRSACRRDDRCRAYTHNLETDTCYLKDRLGSPEGRRSTVSGVKEERGWSGVGPHREDGASITGAATTTPSARAASLPAIGLWAGRPVPGLYP